MTTSVTKYTCYTHFFLRNFSKNRQSQFIDIKKPNDLEHTKKKNRGNCATFSLHGRCSLNNLTQQPYTNTHHCAVIKPINNIIIKKNEIFVISCLVNTYKGNNSSQ